MAPRERHVDGDGEGRPAQPLLAATARPSRPGRACRSRRSLRRRHRRQRRARHDLDLRTTDPPVGPATSSRPAIPWMPLSTNSRPRLHHPSSAGSRFPAPILAAERGTKAPAASARASTISANSASPTCSCPSPTTAAWTKPSAGRTTGATIPKTTTFPKVPTPTLRRSARVRESAMVQGLHRRAVRGARRRLQPHLPRRRFPLPPSRAGLLPPAERRGGSNGSGCGNEVA